MRNINQVQFFHSSPAVFKPGDVIEPRMAHGPNDMRGARAYAATEPYHAKLYHRDSPYANGPQGELFSTTYNVERVDPKEDLESVLTTMGGDPKNPAEKNVPSYEVRSAKGFKVTGVNSFKAYPSLTNDPPDYL